MPARILISADPVRVAGICEEAFVGGGGRACCRRVYKCRAKSCSIRIIFFMSKMLTVRLYVAVTQCCQLAA